MSPLVSVVVPVFNGIPHLHDLTESLLAQTYPNLEIVFSEGGSTDDSPAYLATIDDPRVRTITAPPGTGAAGNWTAASEAATGEFVKLVCQDDLLRPDAIAKQVDDLTRHPEAAMAVAQRDVIDAKGNLLYARRGCSGLKAGVMHGPDVMRVAYLTGTNVLGEPLAVLFRREALFAALPWVDTDPFMLDLDLYVRAAWNSEVVVRKESIGSFRVSTSSWSTRLVGEQVRQFERWQEAHARSMPVPPTTTERARAKVGLHAQALLRRGAYRWLSLKGSLKSSH